MSLPSLAQLSAAPRSLAEFEARASSSSSSSSSTTTTTTAPSESDYLALKMIRELGVRTEVAGIQTAPLPAELEQLRPQYVKSDGTSIANIVHGESKIGVDGVLESLADAVLAIVLFQIEADENQSHLISAQFDGLVQACTFFAQLAEQKAVLWDEVEEQDNKQQMLALAAKMNDTVLQMANQLKKLQLDQYDQQAKEELLFRCRDVMEVSVGLLEASDRYDIRKILRLCKATRLQAKQMNRPPPLAEFEAAVGSFIQEAVLLAKYVAQRVDYISDPVMEARLDNANADLRVLPEQLVHGALACLTQGNTPANLSAKENVYTKLFRCIDEIEEATVDSQKRMFAGVLMDLEPISRDNLVTTQPDDPNSADSVLGHYESLLGQIKDALEAGAGTKAAKLLREAGKWLDHLNGMAKLKMESMQSGPQKDLLGDAMRRLRQSLTDMEGVASLLRQDPGNAALLEQLARLFDPSIAAEFLELWNGPALSELFGDNVLSALAFLNQLRDAVLENNQPRAVLAAKSAIATLQQQIAEAEKALAELPDGPQKDMLRAAIDKLKAALGDLLRATQVCLAEPGSVDKQRALFAEIERLKVLSGEVAVLVKPARKPGLFDSAALFHATQRVHHSLDGGSEAAASGDPARLAQALRGLTEALAEQSALARNVAATTQYAAQKEQINAVFGRVQANLGQLVQHAKDMALRPGDARVVDALQQCIVVGHRNADELKFASGAAAELLLGSVRAVDAALDALAAAARGSDEPAFQAALNDCRELVTFQTRMANEHGQLRPSLKDGVAAAAVAHVGRLRELLADADALRAEAARVGHVHKPHLRDTSLQLVTACLYSDDEALTEALFAQSHHISSTCDQLAQRVLDAGDRNGIAAAARQTHEALQDELELLALAARRLPQHRAKLTAVAEALQQRRDGLAAAVNAAVGDPHAPLGLHLSSVRSLAQEAAETVLDPERVASRMETASLRLARSAKPMLEAPITAHNRDDILAAVQQLENLKAMSVAASRLAGDAKLKSELRTLSLGVAPLQDTLRSTADAIFRGKATPASEADLRNALRESKLLAGRLVDKAYAGNAAQRLRDNGAALDADLAALHQHVAHAHQAEAAQLLPIVDGRLQLQQTLAAAALQHCTNPEAREPLQSSLDRVAGAAAPFAGVCSAAIAAPGGAQSAAAGTLIGAVRPAAAQLTDAALAALQPPPVRTHAQPVEITSLSTAAQHMQAATEGLSFDDTPKGRLNRAAWNIAQGMRKLADAAERDDKRAMIEAAREVASYTATLVQDATLVGSICRDGRVTNQLVSMARAGKNWSVQLKILCAVKASSGSKDDTAESQLLTCATGLATSVVQCVREADVAELKHK